MKKWLIVSLVACLGISLSPRDIRVKMGPYYGYFTPNEEMIQTIYGKGSEIYGARLGITFPLGLSAWFHYLQYRVIGKTTFDDNSTMALNPLTIAVRYTAPFKFFVLPYASLGMTFVNFKEEAAIGSVKGNGSGLTYEIGGEFRISSRLFFDFSFRYNSIKVSPTGFSVDVGGFQYGGAFVIAF